MARILAIDYGTKRTGIAVTDETQTFAFGLQTVATNDLAEFLEKYLSSHTVAGIVVGDPRRMNNEPTQGTPHANGFVRRLKKAFPDVPVYRIDERFTSKMASQSIIDSGIKKESGRNSS